MTCDPSCLTGSACSDWPVLLSASGRARGESLDRVVSHRPELDRAPLIPLLLPRLEEAQFSVKCDYKIYDDLTGHTSIADQMDMKIMFSLFHVLHLLCKVQASHE